MGVDVEEGFAALFSTEPTFFVVVMEGLIDESRREFHWTIINHRKYCCEKIKKFKEKKETVGKGQNVN